MLQRGREQELENGFDERLLCHVKVEVASWLHFQR